jgi:ribonuclease Z
LTDTDTKVLFEDEKVIVSSFPLKHRVYTNGFLFKEKNKERKLNIEKLEEYGVNKVYFQKVKYGGDITLDSGEIIMNEKLSFDPAFALSYAFCSDTRFDEQLVPYIKNVTVLYHESTFLEKESHLAEKTLHATAAQAATIAKMAGVQTLVLGHFSTRYESIERFKDEAVPIFSEIILADDGKVFEFDIEGRVVD